MVKICQTRLLKINFEIIPKKRIFRFLPNISAGHAWSWKFFFANFQILGPLGCQGWVVIPQNVKKKSKSLHPNGQLLSDTFFKSFSSTVNMFISIFMIQILHNVTNSWIFSAVGRNCLLGNRKKVAKFLMRTFTCRSTFLHASMVPFFCHSWLARLSIYDHLTIQRFFIHTLIRKIFQPGANIFKHWRQLSQVMVQNNKTKTIFEIFTVNPIKLSIPLYS